MRLSELQLPDCAHDDFSTVFGAQSLGARVSRLETGVTFFNDRIVTIERLALAGPKPANKIDILFL
jgi:hypothetical protein